MKRRLFTAGVTALAVATFALTGCADPSKPGTGDSQPPASSAPAAASAKEAFTAAVKKLNETSSKAEITMDGAATMKGSALTDPKGKKAHVTNEVSVMGTSVKTEMISINGELWAKMSGIPGVPDKWMHVAADKVKDGSSLDITENNAKLETAAVTVERDGDTGFKGVIDLTKTGTASEDMLKQLGDKAKSVPFTAKVDAQGRLTSMVVDMSAISPGVGKLTTAYSGFGDPVTIAAPAAADVVEMPAQILDGMNKVTTS